MDILRNPITVKSLAQQIKTASDSYIARKLTEKQFRELIHHYARNHGNKLFSRCGFNSTIVNRIGKKRISLLSIMLDSFQMSIIG